MFWTIDHGFQVLHIRHDDRFHCVLYLLRPPARILLLLCQLPLPKVPSDDLYLPDGTCNYSPLLFYYLLFPKAALAPGIPFRAMSWNVVLFFIMYILVRIQVDGLSNSSVPGKIPNEEFSPSAPCYTVDLA